MTNLVPSISADLFPDSDPSSVIQHYLGTDNTAETNPFEDFALLQSESFTCSHDVLAPVDIPSLQSISDVSASDSTSDLDTFLREAIQVHENDYVPNYEPSIAGTYYEESQSQPTQCLETVSQAMVNESNVTTSSWQEGKTNVSQLQGMELKQSDDVELILLAVQWNSSGKKLKLFCPQSDSVQCVSLGTFKKEFFDAIVKEKVKD